MTSYVRTYGDRTEKWNTTKTEVRIGHDSEQHPQGPSEYNPPISSVAASLDNFASKHKNSVRLNGVLRILLLY
jgi:hypothetical protein